MRGCRRNKSGQIICAVTVKLVYKYLDGLFIDNFFAHQFSCTLKYAFSLCSIEVENKLFYSFKPENLCNNRKVRERK